MNTEQEIEQQSSSSADKIHALINNIEKVIKGHHEQMLQVITCLIAKGAYPY